MTDLDEIKISQISDIKLIYFYNANSLAKNNENKYLGLKVVYGKHNTISYDYRSEHFESLINKTLDVYKKEKNKNNIILLGDITKNIVNNDIHNLGKENNTFLQEEGIPLFNNNSYKVLTYENYIKDLFKYILEYITKHPLIEIDSIEGFNLKYKLNYSIEELKREMYFNAFFKDDILNININYINDNIKNVNAEIKFLYDKVIIEFEQSDKKYFGNITYDYNNKLITKKMIYNGITVDLQEDALENTKEDIEILEFYKDLLDFSDIKGLFKTGKGSFIQFNQKVEKTDSSNYMVQNKSNNIIIKENEASFYLQSNTGFLRDENLGILFSLDEEKERISLRKVLFDDREFVVIERFYPIVDKSLGFYKNNNENKYNYCILEVEKNTKLNKPFELVDIYVQDDFIRNTNKIKRIVGAK